MSEVLTQYGVSKGTLNSQVKSGTFPPPVSIGARAIAWPSNEVDKVIRARVAGVCEDGLRELVRQIVNERKEVV
jgi:prophage regulatory protein